MSLLLRLTRSFSTQILKSYPNFVERQVDIQINTSSGDEFVEIDRETSVQIPKPSTYLRTQVNYIDTNPLGDKHQSIVLLVHGYPGTYQTTINLIEEFQRRNYRCIAPDMPYCGKTRMPLWSGLVWKNSIFLRARFLGELLKTIMGDKLIPIHTVVGMNENSYTLMSMIDQYEYLRCKSLIIIDPTPRKLIRFFPLAKLAFDFGRLPLHWPVAKFLLKMLGYKQLLNYSQRDIMAALRIWMIEDTHQYDAYLHNLWLSRLRTFVIVSDEDKHLNRNLLDNLIRDLSVEPFNKLKMPNIAIKKYACDHNELLTDRASYLANDIEMFLSRTVVMSPSVPIRHATRTATTKSLEINSKDDETESKIELDENAYRRASANDFFSKAFGPMKSELKPSQSHSLRSALENVAAGFIQQPPKGTQRETLATVKEEMRKKNIRIDTKK